MRVKKEKKRARKDRMASGFLVKIRSQWVRNKRGFKKKIKVSEEEDRLASGFLGNVSTPTRVGSKMAAGVSIYLSIYIFSKMAAGAYVYLSTASLRVGVQVQ